MKKHEWRLTWHGMKDSECLRALIKYLRVFPLFRDSEAHLVDYAEYTELVSKKLIEPPRSYWQIEKNQVGLISKAYYESYTKTWDLIGTAKGDFETGWDACEARYKFLRDWDEAIQMEKDRKKALRKMRRKIEIPILASIKRGLNIEAYRKRYELEDCRWKENRHGYILNKDGDYLLIVVAVCTEEGLNDLAGEICNDITY